jgi:hypothetical protein
MPDRRTRMWCQKYRSRTGDGWDYRHFSMNPIGCKLSDPDVDPIRVDVQECIESPECYWSWWEFGDTDRFTTMTYSHRLILEVCFPYGSQAEMDRGSGLVLPVQIIEMVECPVCKGDKLSPYSHGICLCCKGEGVVTAEQGDVIIRIRRDLMIRLGNSR